MNGVLNLSVLDGWWAEACEHGVNGWAIGDEGAGDDEADLDALHRALANDVLPAWRNPKRWRAMMRASIDMAVERFSSDRMVLEYFERLYDAGAVSSPSSSTGVALRRAT
jgi:starch phosphorylase